MSHILTKYEKKKRRITLNGLFYAAISSASFGFSPLFSIGLLTAGLSNTDILSYRWAIAGLVLMIYAAVKKKTLRLNSFEEFWKIGLLSALRALTSITLLIGYANIASGVATTINFMYPVIVLLCMMLFHGEEKSFINLGAIGLSIAGVYLLASGDGLRIDGGNTTLGLVCSIISAVCFAAYYILIKRLRADKIEVVKFTTWIMMLSALYFITAGLISHGKITIVTNGKLWLYILGLGLWATMVSNFTGVKAVRRIGPTLTSILGALQPLTAVALGVLFLDEHLGFKTITGMILIMISVMLVVTHQNTKKHH
jgi:drug/metabolite transporter (DMT)-like permease